MNLLITICARGGSKGIPGKNIRMLNGKELIGYSLEIAQKFSELHHADIAISTDSESIRSIAEKFGISSNYRRPAALASDNAGKIEVIRHILEHSEDHSQKTYDYVLDLDITSPLRTLGDLEHAFQRLQDNDEALNIFSVNPANRNPYFNMVELQPDGFVTLVKNSGEIKSRQQAPPVYDMNASFYFYKKAFFDQGWNGSITPKSLAFVMNHYCFDLDHPIDFTVMEIMIREQLLDITL